MLTSLRYDKVVGDTNKYRMCLVEQEEEKYVPLKGG